MSLLSRKVELGVLPVKSEQKKVVLLRKVKEGRLTQLLQLKVARGARWQMCY